ncbi:MAG: intradiol ring-cleavage dioxygenase [Acidimicrobiales bacterium]
MSIEQPQLPSRRRMLGLIGGLGAAVVVAGCGDDATTSAAPTTTAGNSSATTSTTTAGATSTTAAGAPSTTAAAAVTSCTKIPEETAGPYPGDGTNGPNALTQSGIVRSDIRSSTTTGKVAAGVPLTIKLTIVDSKNGCKTLAGAAVYLWHCDQAGLYSMYSQGVTGENYLRGVQATDSNGVATFTSIFPAAYSGRWPHIHFEIFPSLASATNGQNKTAVSQLALPDDICKAVFATAGYSQSVTNHARTSLTSDNVFSDGVSLQTPTVTGNTAAGYVATLLVAV